MGRYYNGDIKGKFWFGVQSSDAADRFGVQGTEPSELNYSYQKEDLEYVELEIKNIIETVGQNNVDLLDGFFNKTNGYNDVILQEHGVLEIFNEHKAEYADLELGIKIRDCIKENGQCEFTAEL